LLRLGLPVWLVEEPLFFTQYAFHRQKLVYHRATLLHYRQRLEAQGLTVHYLRHDEPAADSRQLPQWLRMQGVTALHCHDLVDDWLERRLQRACTEAGVALHVEASPQFINDTTTLAAEFAPARKRFLLQAFYQRQRQRQRMLLDEDGGPRGGQWSFDADNRLRFPARQQPPPVQLPPITPLLETARAQIATEFPSNPGALDGPLRYPLTHEQAAAWLQDFLEWRFAGFGPYEDAIVADAHVLHHSVLTPMLNNGLLTPRQVIDAVLQHADAANIPLNSVEGFVRQVLGWREFIRGIYHFRGRQQRMANHFGCSNPMPAAFYEGTTGLPPVDFTIRKLLATGYCHHIERLMVLGNLMLLCEIHPAAVYRWFMELFIDAYDWVMVPNVFGMGLTSEGGIFTTKPYICGSNYLRKMSDYQPGPWCDVMDGLLWRFVANHEATLKANHRLAPMVANLPRVARNRPEIFSLAEAFIDNHTRAA
jgi:deoxyribodipyrimidine photolyase-related protein